MDDAVERVARRKPPKICICGWNKSAGRCPYPIDCKIKVEPFQHIAAAILALLPADGGTNG